MASTSLSRTSVSATNKKTWTLSMWFKRAGVGNSRQFVMRNIVGGGTSYLDMELLSSTPDVLSLFNWNGSTVFEFKTNQVFRDFNGWYHVVYACDTTQATQSDRFKMWVNGEQVTSFATATYPAQNVDTNFLTADNLYFGTAGTSLYFEGQMSHVHMVEGTAYNADTFGEYDSTTGIWKPKTAPSVTYGGEGCFLKFENSGSMGTDSSGNGNNFTVNGTMTQTIDTPSNVFSTINPLNSSETSSTFFFTSFGNTELTATNNDSTRQMGITLNPENMKGYFEMKVAVDNNWQIHVQDITRRVTKTPYSDTSNPTYRYTNAGSISYGTGAGWSNLIASYTSSSSTGDIIGVAFDFTGSNKNVWFHLNGTYGNNGSGVGNPSTGEYPALTSTQLTKEHYAFLFSVNTGGSDSSVQANFGNGYFGTTAVSSAQNPDDGIGIFEFTPPTGYKALCTKSINSQEYD